MIGNKIQIALLDKKGVDEKKNYNYRQQLKRFEKYTKRKYDTCFVALIGVEAINET